MKVLYVAYEGVSEPLGQSQILPYLTGLVERGHQIEILGFEKHPTSLCFRMQLAPGLRYTALRYHKWPSVPATAYDMLRGFLVALYIGLIARVELIHVRSYVAYVMIAPWFLVSKIPCVFQTEGFWADEKVEAGTWSGKSLLYRLAKRLECWMYQRATVIVCLTSAAKKYILEEYPFRTRISAPIEVVTTCTNLERFKALPGIFPESGVLIYSGSLGGWYLGDEMVKFYLVWRKFVQKPRFVLMTHSNTDEIKKIFCSYGIPKELECLSVNYYDVLVWLSKARAAICFIRPSFSKLGSAPTKLGEFLACGLPVAANLIGDMRQVLEGSPACIVLENFSDKEIDKVARKLADISKDQSVRLEARRLAESSFSLDRGVQKYHEIYQTLCAA